MSDGKGGRGGDDAERSKGRRGSTVAKESLTGMATTRTPSAAMRDGKTPRTPETQGAVDRAVVDAAARQAAGKKLSHVGKFSNVY